MRKLIAIGELLIDFTSTNHAKLKDVEGFQKNPGGAPANVACQARRLGANSALISQVGDDPFGHFLYDTISQEGVDTRNLLFSKQYETSLAFVSVDSTGERDFTFYRKNAADLFLDVHDLSQNLFESGDILHFGSVDLVPSKMKETHEHIIQEAKLNHVIVSFDPNLRFSLWNDRDLLRQTVIDFMVYPEIVKVSLEEALFLSGKASIEEAIRYLWKPNHRAILVTDGAKGAYWYYSKDEFSYVPSFSVKAIDTTGAGDAFIGSILTCILDSKLTGQMSWKDTDWISKTLRFAHACSAIVVTRRGAIPALPKRSEVFDFLASKSNF